MAYRPRSHLFIPGALIALAVLAAGFWVGKDALRDGTAKAGTQGTQFNVLPSVTRSGPVSTVAGKTRLVKLPATTVTANGQEIQLPAQTVKLPPATSTVKRTVTDTSTISGPDSTFTLVTTVTV